MALSHPQLAQAGNAASSWASSGREIPEFMGMAPYRNVKVLVLGWELRHLWQDLRRLEVPGISLARRESFLKALECRPTTIIYNSDRGARPPIVGGLIGDVLPAFVAVGGDSLLEALAKGADAVFHLPEKSRDRNGQERQAFYERRQVIETMAKELKGGIQRVRQPCRLTADGGLRLHIQGVLSLEAPVALGGFVLHIPPPGLLDRFSPGPTQGRLISDVFSAGRAEGGAVVHPMPEVQQYLSSFQPAQVKAARLMPQRVLPALQLLQQEPRAIDLAASNPVLFWLLIDEMQRRRKLPEEAATLVLAKQTLILGTLLGDSHPAPASKVKLCKRFELPNPLLPQHLVVIRETLQSEVLSQGFRHWQRIPYQFLALEDSRIPYSNWLRESSNHGTEPGPLEFYPLLRDTLELAEELGHTTERVLGCRTRQQIVQLHDQYMETRIQQQGELDPDRDVPFVAYPDAPFSGSSCIQPILDSQALHREGQEMHHCVSLYNKQIQEGNRFIYRVLEPERATLELDFTPSGGWAIKQLTGRYNHPVQDETREFVHSWLAGCMQRKAEEEARELRAAERQREQEDRTPRPETPESLRDELRRHQSWAPRQWRVDERGRIVQWLNNEPLPPPPGADNRGSNDFPSIFSRRPRPDYLQLPPFGPDEPNPPPQPHPAIRETKGQRTTRSLRSLTHFFGIYAVFRLFGGFFG